MDGCKIGIFLRVIFENQNIFNMYLSIDGEYIVVSIFKR